MLILTYGSKQPQTGDRGPTVFPALEANIAQFDSHNHNGVNSAKLLSSAMDAVTISVLAANWVDLGDGYYKQLLNMPANIDFDKSVLQVRLVNGTVIHPTIKRISSVQFELYVSDNTIDLKVIFG